MTKTMINCIDLDFQMIEIHHNKLLTNKPYLVRVFQYNNFDPEELRLDETEIKNLYNILKENKLL